MNNKFSDVVSQNCDDASPKPHFIMSYARETCNNSASLYTKLQGLFFALKKTNLKMFRNYKCKSDWKNCRELRADLNKSSSIHQTVFGQCRLLFFCSICHDEERKIPSEWKPGYKFGCRHQELAQLRHRTSWQCWNKCLYCWYLFFYPLKHTLLFFMHK